MRKIIAFTTSLFLSLILFTSSIYERDFSNDSLETLADANGTLVINRSCFPSGQLAYNVTDNWSAKASTGETVSGQGDIYSDKNTTYLQTKNSGVSTHYHNTSALPGFITSISVSKNSGTDRTFNVFASSTALISTTIGLTKIGTVNDGGSLTVDSANKFIYFYLQCTVGTSYLNNITISYIIKDPITLSSLNLSGEYPTSFLQNETFSHDGMIVKAKYSDNSEKDVTDLALWANYDMSSIGEQTITVSYDDDELDSSISTTYIITIVKPKDVSSFKLLNDPMPTNNKIIVTAETGVESVIGEKTLYILKFDDSTYGAGKIIWNSEIGLTYYHYECDDSDGGYIEPTFTKNGTFILTISYPGCDDLTITYVVSGFPNTSYVNDKFTYESLGITTTSYKDWSLNNNESNAKYLGNTAGDSVNEAIQMRAKDNSGIVASVSGGFIYNVTIVFSANTSLSRSVEIYGKNTTYNATSDLYDSNKSGTLLETLEFNQNNLTVSYSPTSKYSFIGFKGDGGAVYITSISITWGIEEEIIDTLTGIEITGNLTNTSYYIGQSILLDGLNVIGSYQNAGNVSLIGNNDLVLSSDPATATDKTITTITVTASFGGFTDTYTYSISVLDDSVTNLSWTNRGTINVFSGVTLNDAINTSTWHFVPTWASGKNDSPEYGLGENDVHIGLYSEQNPSSEASTLLSDSYIFTNSDNGKYIIASYHGVFSKSNTSIVVTKWRSVIESGLMTGEFDFSSGKAYGSLFTETSLGAKYISLDGLSVPTISNITNFYDGNYSGSGLNKIAGVARIGKSGKFTLTFSNSTKIKSITMGLCSWSSTEDCTISVTNSNSYTTSFDSNFIDNTFVLTQATNVITISCNSARAYINRIQINVNSSKEIGKTDDCLGLETFIDTYLYMNNYDPTLNKGVEGDGWCADDSHHYYSTAKTAFNLLNLNQKSLFITNKAYSNEYERLNAWAVANGEVFTKNDENIVLGAMSNKLQIQKNNNYKLMTLTIVLLFTVSSAGIYYFVRKEY